jgi:hypothetical protein
MCGFLGLNLFCVCGPGVLKPDGWNVHFWQEHSLLAAFTSGRNIHLWQELSHLAGTFTSGKQHGSTDITSHQAVEARGIGPVTM